MGVASTLNAEQYLLYLEHGQALADYPVQGLVLARQLGVSRHSVRTLQAYVDKHGPPQEVKPEGAIHLVIGDCHVGPDQDLSRFEILGHEWNELYKEAAFLNVPLRIVFIGDVADMHSLSYFDKGKMAAEGSRYADDIEALVEAMRVLRGNVSSDAWRYATRVWIEGNHEYRAQRYMNDNPELQGVLMGPYDVFGKFGFECVPFLDYKLLDGVGYVHYMQNKSGRAISSVNFGRALLLAGHRSVTVGHAHVFDAYDTKDALGLPINTMCCGCFFTHNEDYAKQSNDKWWRGLVVKRNVKGGNYDFEKRGIASLYAKYGMEIPT